MPLGKEVGLDPGQIVLSLTVILTLTLTLNSTNLLS